MSLLTDAQIIALWVKAGGSIGSAPLALAHALAESSGRSDVTSANPDGGTNVGLYQLDTRGVGAGRTVAQLQDPATNTRITVQATKDGRDWGPWSGPPGPHLAQANAAVRQFQAKADGSPGGLLGVASDILKGITSLTNPGAAASGVAGAVGRLVQLPGQVTGFFGTAETAVQRATWLLDPGNWMRVVAFIAGVGLAGLGLYTFTKAGGK